MTTLLEVERQAILNNAAIYENASKEESEVQKFYKNSVIFITGASGFMGKQLIEKIFRCCDVSKVYMLLRPKRGVDSQNRVQEILKDPIFEQLHKRRPGFGSKITVIEGDVAEMRLGISDQDWRILTEEVQIILHVAATTRFEEPLRSATLINVRGTRETLLLAKSCQQLKSFVHVSTAYSHATSDRIGGNVDETFYPAPIVPDTLISMVENMDECRINDITKSLIKGWPNTYTFTKAVAEELIRTNTAGLPICIVRPAIVSNVYKELYPGWLDTSCLYGIIGIILGCGLGVIHVVYVRGNGVFAFIPCDYVNNAIIVAGKETALKQPKTGDDTKIYTVSSTYRKPVRGRKIMNLLHPDDPIKKEALMSTKILYYPWEITTTNTLAYAVLSVLFHMVPAYLADGLCFVLGKKRRFVKIASKLYRANDILQYFTLNEWNFVDKNLENLSSSLSKQDKILFNFDVTDIDWDEYFLYFMTGLRKYILKDGLVGLEEGIKKRRYLKIIHYVLMGFNAYVIWKLLGLLLFLVNWLIVLFKV